MDAAAEGQAMTEVASKAPASRAGDAAGAQPPPPVPFTRERAQQLATALLVYMAVNTSAQLLTTTLPDVQAAVGASADEASWIATAFTMGLFGGLVLATPLMRGLGLGRYVAACAGLYGALAWLCTFSPDLPTLVALRAGQGLAAGGVGPSAFVAVFTLAGRPRLMAGLALLAFTLLLPANLGPALAGPLEAWVGWQGLFAVQALVGMVAALAAAAILPRPAIDAAALRGADWGAIVLLGALLAALTLVLSQGTRRFWLEATIIHAGLAVAVGASAGFLLLAARRPGSVLNPRLLLHRPFAAPVTLNLLFRTALAGATFLAPQFLATLHGYRPLELSGIFAWALAGQASALPLAWGLLHRLEGRTVIALGLMLFTAGAMLLGQVTSLAAAPEFRLPMLLLGAGQVLFLVPNLQAGGEVLTPADGPTASLAFNVTSTGGATLGAGLASHLAVERQKFHSNRLGDHVSGFAGDTAARLSEVAAVFEGVSADAALGETAAAVVLARQIRVQATTLAYADVFLLCAAAALAAALGVLLVTPQPRLRGGRRDRPPLTLGVRS